MKNCAYFCVFSLLMNGILTERLYGDCGQLSDSELIWEYDVRRSYRPKVYQEAESTYGPTRAIITCIRIDSLFPEDNDAAWITEGGINQNFVKIKFRSKTSKRLRYKVYAYGRMIEA